MFVYEGMALFEAMCTVSRDSLFISRSAFAFVEKFENKSTTKGKRLFQYSAHKPKRLIAVELYSN